MLKKMIPYSLICGCKLSVLFTFVLRGISGSGGRGTRGVRPWPIPGGAIARQGGVPFQWVRGVADKVHLITVLIVSLVYHIVTIGHPARIWTVVRRHFFRILQLSPPPLSGIDRIIFLKKENGSILLLVTANMNWTQSLSLFFTRLSSVFEISNFTSANAVTSHVSYKYIKLWRNRFRSVKSYPTS